MKKFITIGLFLVAFATSNCAQSAFSKQNLEQASQEDLNIYLKSANSQKTTGIVLSIAGSVAAISILELGRNADINMSLDTAVAIFLAGSASTLIGIPLLIVGSSRVKKIENTFTDKVLMEMTPCSFHNYIAHNNQPGVTLKIKF